MTHSLDREFNTVEIALMHYRRYLGATGGLQGSATDALQALALIKKEMHAMVKGE